MKITIAIAALGAILIGLLMVGMKYKLLEEVTEFSTEIARVKAVNADLARVARHKDDRDSLLAVIAALRDSLSNCESRSRTANQSLLTSAAPRPRRAAKAGTAAPPAPPRREPLLTSATDSLRRTIDNLSETNRELARTISILAQAPNHAAPDIPETPIAPVPLPDYVGPAPLPSPLDYPVRSPISAYGGVDIIPDSRTGVYPVFGIRTSFNRGRNAVSVETAAARDFTAVRFGFRFGVTLR